MLFLVQVESHAHLLLAAFDFGLRFLWVFHYGRNGMAQMRIPLLARGSRHINAKFGGHGKEHVLQELAMYLTSICIDCKFWSHLSRPRAYQTHCNGSKDHP